MSKTVYINHKILPLLKETALLGSLPDDILATSVGQKTPLSNNPAFPDVYDDSFIQSLTEKQFETAKEELKKIGTIDDVPETKMEEVLEKLILKCQEEEKPFKNALEKLCYNYVVKFFGVPDDMVQMELDLVEEVSIDGNAIQLDPIKVSSDAEYDSLDVIKKIRREVGKRRVLNVLAMGAGMQISSNIKSYVADIYEINPKLPELYRKIIALNDYLLFSREFVLTEENKMQMGTVMVGLKNVDDKVLIHSQGKIFPVLLSETIRGFFDLFGSHGLPEDPSTAIEVMRKADYLKAEPWDMRLGPALWTLLSDNFEDADSNLIPYLYKIIAKLPIKKFNFFMRETFAHTGTGKRIMKEIIAKAKEQKEFDGFETQMALKKMNKNLLSDEIAPEEL